MALLTAAGNRVVFVSMTPGDCGSHQHAPDEIAAIRRREAAGAAGLAGAEYRCAEFRDLAVFSDDAARRRVTEILRQVQPNLVLTSSPTDYMCDHEATSALVRDACFAAPAPNYKTHAPDAAAPIPAIPHLYFMDAVGGVDREGRRIAPDETAKGRTEQGVAPCDAWLGRDRQRSWRFRPSRSRPGSFSSG